MATTTIIPIRQKKDKSAAVTLSESIRYIKNPKKTEQGELVKSYCCSTDESAADFIAARHEYHHRNGRDGSKRDVLGYHIRQSFKPGEVTPEQANAIGYELAMSFTKGNHQFIVTTHTDKAHVHNHIIFNSVRFDATKKFRDFKRSGAVVARISDHLCIQNGLSVIEEKKEKSQSYDEWLGSRKPLSWKAKLGLAIEEAIAKAPEDYAAFLAELEAMGYEMKRGKHIAFRAPGQKNFTRLRIFGEGYSRENIEARLRLARRSILVTQRKEKAEVQNTPVIREASLPGLPSSLQSRIRRLVDIANNPKAQESPGYARWAKTHNLKEASKTLLYLQQNNLDDITLLQEKLSDTSSRFDAVFTRIKACDERMKNISELQKQIANYRRTRDVYQTYRGITNEKKRRAFQGEHASSLLLHENAKKYFDTLGTKKLPAMPVLKQEYASLLAEKKLLYKDYHPLKKEKQDMLLLCRNVEDILGIRFGTEENLQEKSQNTSHPKSTNSHGI